MLGVIDCSRAEVLPLTETRGTTGWVIQHPAHHPSTRTKLLTTFISTNTVLQDWHELGEGVVNYFRNIWIVSSVAATVDKIV